MENLVKMMEEKDSSHLNLDKAIPPAQSLAPMLDTDVVNGRTHTADDFNHRQSAFGANLVEERKLTTYWEFCKDALGDTTIQLLLVMSVISIVMESTVGDHKETGWIDGFAIMLTCAFVVNAGSIINFRKQALFAKLQDALKSGNLKRVIRDGVQLDIKDSEIVVGDIVCFNSVNLASIPADGLLVDGTDVKMDESALTGEPKLISKEPDKDPYILAGTIESEGEAFSSAVHGAGRAMSRHEALKRWFGSQVVDELADRGITIRSPSSRGVAEEAPGSYKDVTQVVEAADRAHLARMVARMDPVICVKG